jgi:hypothetical protein
VPTLPISREVRERWAESKRREKGVRKMGSNIAIVAV